MPIKLLALETEKPYRVELIKPDGLPFKDKDGAPGYIDVLSLDSRKARGLAQTRRDAAAMPLKAAQRDAVEVDTLVALTAGWRLLDWDGNDVTDDEGKPLVFNEQNARMLYDDPAFSYITDQVRAGVSLRVNFMPKAPTA